VPRFRVLRVYNFAFLTKFRDGNATRFRDEKTKHLNGLRYSGMPKLEQLWIVRLRPQVDFHMVDGI
jgi:hypothetical protein